MTDGGVVRLDATDGSLSASRQVMTPERRDILLQGEDCRPLLTRAGGADTIGGAGCGR